MNLQLLAVAAACGAALLATTACGDDSTTDPTAAAHLATATLPATRPASPQAPAPADTRPPAAPSSTATPALTPPAGSQFEPAPIDRADLLVEESNPVQYSVHVTSGLPSGCHVFDHTAFSRNGTEITVDVLNRLPADPIRACTAIYGTHETTVQLGSDFVAGTTYRVHVNQRTIEFTAQ